MLLRKWTSINGLSDLLTGITTRNSAASTSVSDMTGVGVGGLAAANTEVTAYIDGIFASIDLTQVEANRLNLVKLNGPITDPESYRGQIKDIFDADEAVINTSLATHVSTPTAANQAAVDAINSTTDITSKLNKFKALYGTATYLLTTVQDLATNTSLDVAEQNALDATVATRMTEDMSTITVTTDPKVNTYMGEMVAEFSAYGTARTAKIAAAGGVLSAYIDTTFLKADSYLSDVTSLATARNNLGAASEPATKFVVNKSFGEYKTMVASPDTSGIITFPINEEASVLNVSVVYGDGTYDNPSYSVNVNGEVVIVDQTLFATHVDPLDPAMGTNPGTPITIRYWTPKV